MFGSKCRDEPCKSG